MRIEPATVHDLDDLVAAWIDLARDQRRHGSHLHAEANREAIRPVLGHHVAADTALVARDGGVVGFVNFGLEEGALESDATRGMIYNVYVDPAVRGEGVGSALLDAAEAALAERGADVVALEAMADNEDARRLYRRRGYRPYRVQYERPIGDGPPGQVSDGATGSTESDTPTRRED